MGTLWHVLNPLLMVPKSQETWHITSETIELPASFQPRTDSVCVFLWWRVPVCFGECVAPMAVFLLMQVAPRGREWSSLTGERRGRWWWEGVTLQPPSTPCAWAHSVMKWPVSWRPYPNNGPIQPVEESLSGLGWIRYLWFRAAAPLSLSIVLFSTPSTVACVLPSPLLCQPPGTNVWKSCTKKRKHVVFLTRMFSKAIMCHCLHYTPLCFYSSYFASLYYVSCY